MRLTDPTAGKRLSSATYSVLPGDVVATWLASVGIDQHGCECRSIQGVMNGWGPDLCEYHIDDLTARIERSFANWQKRCDGRTVAEKVLSVLPVPRVAIESTIRLAILKSRQSAIVHPVETADENAIADELRLLHGPWLPRPAKWNLTLAAREAQARAIDARQYCDTYEKPRWTDERGIVIAGGGKKYIPACWMLLAALRELGCKLPVEIWYRGRGELDHYCERMFASLGATTCVNADDYPCRINGGWNTKIAAIRHCSFRDVLYLDADVFPARDPTYLFDAEQFTSAGACFWPDLPNVHGLDIEASAFEVMRLPVPGKTRLPTWHRPSDYTPFESGQILVDKSRHWRSLDLCQWLTDHSDFWFPQNPSGRRIVGPSGGEGQFWYVYGDKSLFKLAFDRVGLGYHMMPPTGWFGDKRAGGFAQHDPDGNVVLQHRCQPVTKIRTNAHNSPAGLVNPGLFTALEKAVKKMWRGELWQWHDHGEADTAFARTLIGTAWDVTGLDWRLIELRDKGIVWPAGAQRQATKRWRVVHAGDSPIVALVGHDNVEWLTPGERGCWRNERIALYQAPPFRVSCHRDAIDSSVYGEIVANDYRLPTQLTGTVVDLGAHCGFFTLEALRRGASRVIAIEPYPDNYRHLATNVRHDARVIPWQVAAWHTSGRIDIARWHSHVGHQVRPDEQHFPVVAVTLKDILDLAGDVEILKIDIEGAEWPVLLRSPDELWSRVRAIVGEYHLAEATYWQRHVDIDISVHTLSKWCVARGFRFEALRNPNDDRVGLFWCSQ